MDGAVHEGRDQLARLADEVREVAVDRDLAQEPETAETAIADELPEDLFGQGLVTTQTAGGGGLVHAREMGLAVVRVQRKESGFSGEGVTSHPPTLRVGPSLSLCERGLGRLNARGSRCRHE